MSVAIKLKPVIKNYAWGNDYFIANLLAIDCNGPMAELWIGTHKQGCSTVLETGQPLSEILDSDLAFCGFSSSNFPILLKVLSIGQSVSIQCHPDSEQAKLGYLAEAEKRKTLDRSLLNYADSNQKAEMLYALTPVTAMCGFRSFEEMTALLKIAVPNLFARYLAKFGSIASLFDGLYRLDKDTIVAGQRELLSRCECSFDKTFVSNDSAHTDCSVLAQDVRDIILDLGNRYFGDPGVFAPLLLNIVHLKPGQAIYLKPRVLHAYISGNGIELMNNSDNVLRAGLTVKHVDLDELQNVMLKDSYFPRPMETVTDDEGTHFICPGGFTLTVLSGAKFKSAQRGPRLFLCTEGQALIGDVSLSKGECCISGDVSGEFSVDACGGTVFLATANL